MKTSKAIRTRLVGTILLAVAIAVVLPAWWYRVYLNDELTTSARQNAERIALAAKAAVQSFPKDTTQEELDGRLSQLEKSLQLTITVEHTPAQAEAPFSDDAGAPLTTLTDAFMENGRIDVLTSVPVAFSSAPLHLQLSVSLPEIQNALQSTRDYAGYAFLAVFIFVLCFTVFPIRRLDNSMSDVIRVADDIGRGDFKKRSLLYSNKDFPALSASIRRMAERIEAHIYVITEQNSQLEAILDSMNEGVMVLDSSCRILTINKAMGRISKHGAKYIGRRPLEMLDSPELQKACDVIVAKKGNGPTVTTMQIEPVKETVYDVTIACLRDIEHDAGEAAAIAVFHDISALKRLERVRSDFVANVSHELRTPLTSIKGYAETILGSLPDTEKTSSLYSFLEIILRNANHMTKIVNELLSLARLEAGSKTGRMETIEAASALQQAYKECAHLKDAQDVLFENKLPQSGVLVTANFEGLVQVFRNLLENAFKYGAARAEGVGKINIWHESNENGYVFAVQDNGPGIPRDKQERVFERFYRVDKHRSRSSGSSGLGLAIAKHIVDQMGGRIWVETPPGNGTGAIFYVSLPRAAADEPALPQEQANHFS